MSIEKTNTPQNLLSGDYGNETEQLFADFVITSHILCALKTNPQLEVDEVEVITRKGCVILSGKLQWEFQKGIVNKIVGKIVGIKEWNNCIHISPAITNIPIWSFSTN